MFDISLFAAAYHPEPVEGRAITFALLLRQAQHDTRFFPNIVSSPLLVLSSTYAGGIVNNKHISTC